jgi:hypothetical protein
MATLWYLCTIIIICRHAYTRPLPPISIVAQEAI